MERVRTRIIRSKRSKAFYKIVKKWLNGEDIPDVDLALNLSSMLTHCLIEIKENNTGNKVPLILGMELDICFQTQCISDLIMGKISPNELRDDYLERYGDGFGIKRY